ncbi:MAG: M20 family metallopeptidase [Acidimicrobiales bacterium]
MTALVDPGTAVRDTAALVAIDSQNPGPLEGECASWVRRRLETAGLSVASQTVAPGRDNLLCTIPGTGEAPRLVLVAHLDTVPFGGGWSRAPLGGEIHGGNLYGRGSCDMKAGLALGMGLLETLHRNGITPRGDVVLCCTVDEEAPHMAGAHALVHEGLVGPQDQVLALEPTGCRLRIAQVGLRWLTVTVRGRQCHAGRAHLGIDANHVMARVIDHVKTTVAGLGLDDELLGPPRVTCGTLHGGVSTNVVPGSSTATFDVRLVPPLTPDAIAEIVERAVGEAVSAFPGAGFEVAALGAARPPVRASETAQLVTGLRQAFRTVTGRVLESGGADGHEAYTDASMIAALTGSDRCTVFGPGSSDVAHTVDEFVPLADIDLVAGVLTRLVTDW